MLYICKYMLRYQWYWIETVEFLWIGLTQVVDVNKSALSNICDIGSDIVCCVLSQILNRLNSKIKTMSVAACT